VNPHSYYYRWFDNSPRGPMPWQALGSTGIVGGIHLSVLRLTEPAADATTVRDALQYALDMQRDAKDADDSYVAGVRAYDTWIASLHHDDSNPHGASFNAQYWAECRRLAVQFLEEARKRLANRKLAPLLDDAKRHYAIVVKHLDAVANALPMDGEWEPRLKDAKLVQRLVEHLEAARDAERQGLAVLERIVRALPAK
jgi:hypothetical protein